MSEKSKIEWTESTWNPITGCSKISPGCMNCYAERLAKRLKAMGQKNYKKGFTVSIHKNSMELPLKWKKPQTIFLNSMSDLFHEKVPINIIQKVFSVMQRAYWHRFQILTKRSLRLLEIAPSLTWSPNIWMGVSVENQNYTYRIDHLRQTGAITKFVSFEPLIEPIDSLNLFGIDWVIAGGESGPGSRPMERSWALNILTQCQDNKVPFFFKQWGGINKKRAGRELKGRTWDEMPIVTNSNNHSSELALSL